MPEAGEGIQTEVVETESQVTIAVDDAGEGSESQANQGDTKSALSEADRAAAVAMIVAANPDVVPELIAGETLAELQQSIEPAREAYQSIAARFTAGPRDTPVPSGAEARVDPRDLSPSAKIAEGLKRR